MVKSTELCVDYIQFVKERAGFRMMHVPFCDIENSEKEPKAGSSQLSYNVLILKLF